MQMPSTLQDEFMRVAQAKEICEQAPITEEERARANTDAVFEGAFRIVVMKSLPAWIDEVCTEHLCTKRL